MELKEVSDLLDAKLTPIHKKLEILDELVTKVDELIIKVNKILPFVPVGNEDVTKQLKALKKVSH
jgi:hypothetical protein